MRRFTVTQLNRELARLLDQRFPNIEVEGEVGQLNVPGSGHAYLDLRDRDDTLSAVVWRDTWNSLSHRPKRGDRVVARGRVGVFGRRGVYQLYITAIRPAGEGRLAAELAKRRARLEAEGLLDPRRKRRLPSMPRFVGVATSLTGAALQDFLKVSGQRFPAARILVAGCVVQGPTAPPSVIQAVDLLLDDGRSEVIVITRGGGSKEDLLAFHDEDLCRWMAHCPVPVVSAVGHQVDTTLLDLVADAVSPTPSAAVLTVLPDGGALRQVVDDAELRALRAVSVRVQRAQQRVDATVKRLRHPSQRLSEVRRSAVTLQQRLIVGTTRRVAIARQHLDTTGDRLHRIDLVDARRQRLNAAEQRLRALSPVAVLDRGYAMVTGPTGVVRSTQDVKPGERLSIRVADGTLPATVDH